MWQHKQDNVMLPDMWPGNQVNAAVSNQSFPPQRVPGEHMENKLGPSYGNFNGDFLGGPSRKRKLTPTDLQGMAPQSSFQFSAPPQPNLQNANFTMGPQMGQSTPNVWVNQAQTCQPTNFMGQPQKDQFSYLNCEPGYWQASEGKSQGSGALSTGNASASTSQPFDQKGLFGSHNQQSGEPAVVSNWHPQVQHTVSQNEANTPFAFPNSYSGNPLVPSQLEGQMSYKTMNHQMPPEVQNVTSGSIVSEGILHQTFLEPKVNSHVNGNTCSQDNNKPGVSYGLSESSQLPYNGGANGRTTLITGSAGSSLCAVQSQDPRLSQSELQIFNSNSFGGYVGKISDNKEQCQANDSLKMKMNPQQLEGPSPCIATDVVENSQSDRTRDPKLDDTIKPLGKPAATESEKLWDGCLQLSSSVTISAVAFFKSGEKLHDTDWYDSVEVKGKVRLEAFEKYIQDLPRSRNRGLMVISICCKEESQGKGLVGMKEVAKGYQKSERVGFAKLSEVVDLYICPRTDVIITILAKHGYFKGMTVAEDKPNSMVGCVVWKKNPASSNSSVKKPESQNDSSTGQLTKSPSHTSMQQEAEKHVSPLQPSQISMPTTSANIESSYSVSGPSSYIAASAPSNSTSTEVGLQVITGPATASIQVAEQPKAILENGGSFMPCQQPGTQNGGPTTDPFDDDDLPEFDFASVRMVPQTTMRRSSNPVLFDKALEAERPETVNSTDMLMLPGPPKAQAVSVPPHRPDYPTFPTVPFPASEVMSPLNRFGQDEPQIPVLPGTQESQRVPNPVVTPSKGLFDDDDDDIPEWCPPELHGPPMRERSLTPMSMSPEPPAPNPSFRSSAPGPQNPAMAPTPAVSRPAFPPQVFLPSAHYTLSSAPQPKPPSVTDMASKSILGPPPKLDEEHPFPPAGKWGDSPRSDDRRPYDLEGKRGEGPKFDDRRSYQPAGKRDEASRFDDRRPYYPAGKRDEGPRFDDRRPYQPAGKRSEDPKFDDRRPYQPAGKRDEGPKFDDRRPYQSAGKWDDGPEFDDRRPYKRDEGPKFDDRRPYETSKWDEGPKFDDRHPYQPVGKRDEGSKYDDRRPYQAGGRRGDSPKFDDRRSFRPPSRWDEVPRSDGSRSFPSPGRRSRR